MHNNIDSPSFNPKVYFKSFIKDKSVEEVLKKKSELQQGINSQLFKQVFRYLYTWTATFRHLSMKTTINSFQPPMSSRM